MRTHLDPQYGFGNAFHARASQATIAMRCACHNDTITVLLLMQKSLLGNRFTAQLLSTNDMLFDNKLFFSIKDEEDKTGNKYKRATKLYTKEFKHKCNETNGVR